MRLSSSPRPPSPVASSLARALTLLAGSLALLLLPACGRRELPVDTARQSGTFLLGNGAEPQELDPHLTTGVPETRIQRALFEGLVVPDPKTGRPVPGAASSWETSPDGRTFTFRLHPGRRWSDGTPVVAEDFVRSFRRLFTPTLGADYATEFYFIAGARDFHTGRTADFSTVGVRALDPHTLRFDLVDPVPQFLPLLAASPALPIPPHVLARLGALERRGTTWTRPENFVGNGPFVLKEWRPNQRIVVARSPTYGGPAPRLQEIHFHPVEIADTEERMFRAGQLHVTYHVPVAKIPVYRRDQPELLRVAPESRNYYYVFNVDRAPFQDVRVRRAFALALDRARIVAAALRAGQQPALQFAPAAALELPIPARFAEDVAAAQQLLAEAGFPGGAGLPVVPLLISNNERNRLLAETAQEMWRKNLGVRIELEVQEWKVYLDSLKNGSYVLSFDSWNFPTAQQFYSLLTTGNSASYNRWSEPAYDALVAAAAATPDPARRLALYTEMEALLARLMPVVPLYFNVSAHLVRPEVDGWHDNPFDDHPWLPIGFNR